MIRMASWFRDLWTIRASRDVAAVHDVIVTLSPWLAHHACCARVTHAAACDCGLQRTLAPYAWSI